MGKQSKNPAKIEKRQQAKISQTGGFAPTSKGTDAKNSSKLVWPNNLQKFDNINTDSDCSDSEDSNKKKGQLPVINKDDNLQYMIDQGIQQYMFGKDSNIHCGMGKPLTQKEFDEIRKKESINVIDSKKLG
tara:strand:- start:1615 stop:2007 length:393 start_codon:yes stop_codon:yes gene_type:complete